MKNSNTFTLFFTILIGLASGGCSSSDENQNNTPSNPVVIEGSGNNDVLVWSDEFDGNGAINSQFWNYETGGGGWGNQEVQVYSTSSANIVKENGILKITALKKPNGTYTSARITTQNKVDFKYARIDIRAKLPSLAGTWPALWMLGDNFSNSSVGWPKCGEIDIMEQFADKTYVQATCHWEHNGSTAS